MSNRKRLVIFVEGDGDVQAAPTLVERLLQELTPWEWMIVDHVPFRVRGVESLTGRKNAVNWTRFLAAACRSRPNLGAVLLLLDGDTEKVQTHEGKLIPFCAKDVAHGLAQAARAVGAGEKFSVAVVFARQEYESWLIAGVESLAGKPLPDGRSGIRAGTTPPTGDLESAPRDAKGWLSRKMATGYKETLDQQHLTKMVDVSLIRARNLRSFRRLESGLRQLVEAFRTGKHIVSP